MSLRGWRVFVYALWFCVRQEMYGGAASGKSIASQAPLYFAAHRCVAPKTTRYALRRLVEDTPRHSYFSNRSINQTGKSYLWECRPCHRNSSYSTCGLHHSDCLLNTRNRYILDWRHLAAHKRPPKNSSEDPLSWSYSPVLRTNRYGTDILRNR